MHEWAFPDFGALAPAYHVAAGALAAGLGLCVLVAARRLLARWRAPGALTSPPRNLARIWAELRELRGECAASAANLETVVARFRDIATVKIAARDNRAGQLEHLRRELDAKAAVIAGLE